MNVAERAYRLLLRAYPASFRAAYGREMLLVFRDRRREPDARGLRFWREILSDVAHSAPALRLDAWRIRSAEDIQTREEKMRTMAILAVLIGAVESVGALTEGWAGGITSGPGPWLAGVILAAAAGALLVAAGVAMLRRAPSARSWARTAAITCVVVVVLIRFMYAWMSIFSSLLGIVFPIALLLFLWWTRGRGPAAPAIA
jgi:hypothetical protein